MKKYEKNNSIFVKTNLISNFKPSLLLKLNNLQKFRKNHQIYCKNFFIYILLLKYKNNLFKKSNLFIKKYIKKTYTILRSPYRHKLARHQLHLNRYFIKNVLEVSLKLPVYFKSWFKILIYLNFFKNINKIFESNLIYVNNIQLFLPVKFNNNFLLKNFKN